ncbi:unnamed protein product [Linum trigynum]|uniref:Uncharacterized protein n=1 Tax=Linum trigynum TaxID=586398 RepID=A0AAV2CFQ1_9ROSI
MESISISLRGKKIITTRVEEEPNGKEIPKEEGRKMAEPREKRPKTKMQKREKKSNENQRKKQGPPPVVGIGAEDSPGKA